MISPESHVKDSLKLISDGRVELFELTPTNTSGSINFKNDDPITWRGKLYEGLPCAISGEGQNSDTGVLMPTLDIGQSDIDISKFKTFVRGGYLDNATLVKITVLLEDLLADNLVYRIATYRVKRVAEYSKTRIRLQLATPSDSTNASLPHRTYIPPAFPSVQV
jgi:phage-related protein